MFADRRIVCATPAGRRRYLKILIPYILASPLVDEYQLWLNTRNPLDAAFIRACPSLDPRIRVIEPPEHQPDGNSTVGQFFRTCTADDAIYVRFDDDVVFLENGFFEALLRFRIDNPRYFLVSPLIVNNPLCTYLLTALNLIGIKDTQFSASAFDPTSWQDPHFAYALHRAFLANAMAGQLDGWHFDPREIALNRFGINCISWLGSQFAEFGGRVPFGDDEEWLTVLQPARLGRANCFFGGTSAAHFAYYPQRAELDKSDLLNRYVALAALTLGEGAAGICNRLAATLPITAETLQACSWRAMRTDGSDLGTVRLLPDGTLLAGGQAAAERWALAGDSLVFINSKQEIVTRFNALERDSSGRIAMEETSPPSGSHAMLLLEATEDAGSPGQVSGPAA